MEYFVRYILSNGHDLSQKSIHCRYFFLFISICYYLYSPCDTWHFYIDDFTIYLFFFCFVLFIYFIFSCIHLFFHSCTPDEHWIFHQHIIPLLYIGIYSTYIPIRQWSAQKKKKKLNKHKIFWFSSLPSI